jgi:surfeit locus 1 family protein
MKKLLTFRWVLTTLLVMAALGVLVRLGIWQLDRLEWRRSFNTRVTAQLAAPELDLNREIPTTELFDMEYRKVTVSGEYVHSQEVLLRNQVWEGKLGFRVLTPLKIEGTDWAVLVDRGWIPFDQAQSPERQVFAEVGHVTVEGMIRRPQEKPDIGGVPDPTLAPGETRLDVWTVVNLVRIQEQSSLEMLPVWIQQAPDASWVGPPYRALPEIEITEGPHMGYALQWFAFAIILGIGYPFFMRGQIMMKNKETQSDDEITNFSGRAITRKENGHES